MNARPGRIRALLRSAHPCPTVRQPTDFDVASLPYQRSAALHFRQRWRIYALFWCANAAAVTNASTSCPQDAFPPSSGSVDRPLRFRG
jgi:hypothetical protein